MAQVTSFSGYLNGWANFAWFAWKIDKKQIDKKQINTSSFK